MSAGHEQVLAHPALLDAAQTWHNEDPDPNTRRALAVLLDAARAGDPAAAAELADCFAGPLEFGTAGLRAAMGPGPNRMNRMTVTQATAGLAAWLLEHAARRVVIGYDARHNSKVFARDAAEILAGAGLEALLLPRALPTPVLSYAVRPLDADAGIVITASHNPAADNGYKVFLADGSQLIPPHDRDIERLIRETTDISTLPRGGYVTLDGEVLDGYLRTLTALEKQPPATDVRIVYTPLHGVGWPVMQPALQAAGHHDVHPVPEQVEPDPDFPTVAFPNPEEPGAMDLGLALAERLDADLLIASDPDADRCAVGFPLPDPLTGQTRWRMLSGDETGWLLGWWVNERGTPGAYANSIVSSTLLADMARDQGRSHHETLTGFKWIGRVPDLAYGYEEALGHCVDQQHVADKDGIAPALLLAEMTARLKTDQRSVQDVLDDLFTRYGHHTTVQISRRFTDLAALGQTVSRILSDPPQQVAGVPVVSCEDLSAPGAALPPTPGVRLHLADRSRIIVRPSGTEPKVKCYLQVITPVGTDGSAAAARSSAARIGALTEAMADLLG